jgi:hypothetical protein
MFTVIIRICPTSTLERRNNKGPKSQGEKIKLTSNHLRTIKTYNIKTCLNHSLHWFSKHSLLIRVTSDIFLYIYSIIILPFMLKSPTWPLSGPAEILYAFHIALIRTCPVYLNLFHLIILIIFRKEHELWFSSCNSLHCSGHFICLMSKYSKLTN